MRLLILLIFSTALAFGKDKQKIGNEIDYVGSALADRTTVTGLVRGTYFQGCTGLFGALTKSGLPSRWEDAATFCAKSIRDELIRDGWRIDYDLGTPPINGAGIQMLLIAKQSDDEMEILVTLFPGKAGEVNLSYSQKRPVTNGAKAR